MDLQLKGVLPATVTAFREDGSVDIDAMHRYVDWLCNVPGVTGLVCNGHAGEGGFLTDEERQRVVRAHVDAAAGRVPVISGILSDGTMAAAREAERAASAGAAAALVYPAHSWLRFGYQTGAPVDRYRMIHQASGLPSVLFLYPDSTRATFDIHTILEVCATGAVTAIKNGVRNMARWDDEVPIIRQEFPAITQLTCQDEYLLHTLWEADGALVGFAALAPELIVALNAAAATQQYAEAKAVYDRLAGLTRSVYRRANHLEATVALKVGLHERGLLPAPTVRSPLMPLTSEDEARVRAAVRNVTSTNQMPPKSATPD